MPDAPTTEFWRDLQPNSVVGASGMVSLFRWFRVSGLLGR